MAVNNVETVFRRLSSEVSGIYIGSTNDCNPSQQLHVQS